MSNEGKSNTRAKLMNIFQRKPPPPPLKTNDPANTAAEENDFPWGNASNFIGPSGSSLKNAGGGGAPPRGNLVKDPSLGIALVFDLDGTLVDSSFDDPSQIPGTLDETVAMLKANPSRLNRRLLDTVIYPAAKLRETGKVSAIIMLTNNSSAGYIAGVSKTIYDYITRKFEENQVRVTPITKGIFGETDARKRRFYPVQGPDVDEIPNNEYFFDYIATRLSDGRVGDPGNPFKRLEDVANIMHKLGKSTEHLESRVFMFDDMKSHIISRQLDPRSNYIHIKARNEATMREGPFIAGSTEISDYEPIYKRFGELNGQNVGNKSPVVKSPVERAEFGFENLFGNESPKGGRRIRRRFATRSKKSKSRRRRRLTRHRKLKQRGAGEKCVVYAENGSIKDTWDCAASCNYDKDKSDRCKPYE